MTKLLPPPVTCAFLQLLLLVGQPAIAQEKYPSRPIEIIVPWGAGGGSDQTARVVAKALEAELKISFPVVNAPGGSGAIGTRKLLLNPADGYSLGLSVDGILMGGKATGPQFKLSDFLPIAVLVRQVGALFVAENGRFKTWADVEKEARTKPNTVKILIAAYGVADDVHANYLSANGVKLVIVPQAPSERYASLLGGHADLLYEQIGDVRSYIEGQQMRPVLFFAESRLKEFPDVPTAKEVGYNIVSPQIRWAYVRPGTDPARVKLLSDALDKMAASPEYQAYLKREFAAPDSYVSQKYAKAFIERMLDALGEEAKAAGMSGSR